MSKIVLNKKNLFYNLDLITNKAGGKEKVATALKDNAYGHGIVEMSQMLKEYGIKKAVVKSFSEAIKVKDYFDYILILTDNKVREYDEKFHVTVNCFDSIDKLPNNINIQIKVDTGMHRNGIIPDELEKTIKKLLEKNMNITGVYTHHKSADDYEINHFDKQNEIFKKVKEETIRICNELNISLPAFHSSNSEALFRHEQMNEDFARVGIATYGYLESKKITLKPVLSLWGEKISSRILKKGESVGYGGTYTAKSDMQISTYDIGYGDGFLRINEKDNYITPKGYKVLGRVSMDYTAIDSTDDEVCLFDNAFDLAKVHETITYEIITSLSSELERQIV